MEIDTYNQMNKNTIGRSVRDKQLCLLTFVPVAAKHVTEKWCIYILNSKQPLIRCFAMFFVVSCENLLFVCIIGCYLVTVIGNFHRIVYVFWCLTGLRRIVWAHLMAAGQRQVV